MAGIAARIILLTLGIIFIGISVWTFTDPHISAFYWGIGLIGLYFVYKAATIKPPEKINRYPRPISDSTSTDSINRGYKRTDSYLKTPPIAASTRRSDDSSLRTKTNVCSKCGSSIERDWTSCPLCGSNIIPSCSGCGEKMDSSWVACPNCGREVPKHCQRCNAVLETSWKTCPYCES